ncbi:MAG: methionyl-tRNA formyltransferase [Patescibacteria group bacterium]
MLTQDAKNKTRLIFMGTPDFAVPGLMSLIATPDFAIIGVFTQSDKPIGRKQLLTPTAIKTTALQNNLKIFQPVKIKTTTEIIRSLKPDLIVVIAYGQIIPPDILAIPTYGCLNVHASLLPKYRGAACLNVPILNGDEETGITIMKMEAGLDTGPILKQIKIKLNGQETLETVHDKLAALSADLLIPTLRDFLAKKIKPKEQDESQASYVKTLKKEDGRINWKKTALEIERSVRAYNPWPGTYTLMITGDDQESHHKIIKILKTEHQPLAINKYKIGEIFKENNKLMIQCGQDSLVILNLQIEGKKALSAEEFIRGYSSLIGQTLN